MKLAVLAFVAIVLSLSFISKLVTIFNLEKEKERKIERMTKRIDNCKKLLKRIEEEKNRTKMELVHYKAKDTYKNKLFLLNTNKNSINATLSDLEEEITKVMIKTKKKIIMNILFMIIYAIAFFLVCNFYSL